MRGESLGSRRRVPRGWRPGWHHRRGYRTQDLGRDLSAGLVLTALLVPAGMGYADVARLPVETGLYATVAALVAYALVGPSRVLVLGQTRPWRR